MLCSLCLVIRNVKCEAKKKKSCAFQFGLKVLFSENACKDLRGNWFFITIFEGNAFGQQLCSKCMWQKKYFKSKLNGKQGKSRSNCSAAETTTRPTVFGFLPHRGNSVTGKWSITPKIGHTHFICWSSTCLGKKKNIRGFNRHIMSNCETT